MLSSKFYPDEAWGEDMYETLKPGLGTCDLCGTFAGMHKLGVRYVCEKCLGSATVPVAASGVSPDALQSPCAESLSSPALKQQTGIYPSRYRGRVPWKIKMICTVHPDLEFLEARQLHEPRTIAVMGEIYECWVNMHGAVSAICRSGKQLGVKPDEFEVVQWHGTQLAPALGSSIYLASRYSRAVELVQIRWELVRLGYRITSRWLDGGHELTKEGSTEAAHAQRMRFAAEDWSDMIAADVVVSITEEPRKILTRGGRHVEFGGALALGKRLVVIGWRENVFHCLPQVEFYSSHLDWLRAWGSDLPTVSLQPDKNCAGAGAKSSACTQDP